MSEIEIPPYFICPISLELMKDPVTIPTGITYDRDSIEEWLFTKKHLTCPATQQALDPNLHDQLVTPNTTLRRLIHSWLTLHRLPTPPNSPAVHVTKPHLLKLIDQARKTPPGPAQIQSLRTLRSLASQNRTNAACMESAGAPELLASLVASREGEGSSRDEALAVLRCMRLSETSLKSLNLNDDFVESLALAMRLGSYEPRAHAVNILKSMLDVAEPVTLTNLRPEFFPEFRKMLVDRVSESATKGTLGILMAVCPWGRNRTKAVEAGVVHALIDLLLDLNPDDQEKRVCEMVLGVLELLCQCAEGRAELTRHGAGLAVVAKKVLRVSRVGNEKALRILGLVCRHSANPAVLREMLEVGAVAKLCLVVRVECGSKARERAREMLKMHSRAWRRSSACIPGNLVSSYPS